MMNRQTAIAAALLIHSSSALKQCVGDRCEGSSAGRIRLDQNDRLAVEQILGRKFDGDLEQMDGAQRQQICQKLGIFCRTFANSETVGAVDPVTSSQIDAVGTVDPITSQEIDAIGAVDPITSSEIDAVGAVDPITSSEIDAVRTVDPITSSEIDAVGTVDPITSQEINAIGAVDPIISQEIDAVYAVDPITSSEIDDVGTVDPITSSEIDAVGAVDPITSSEFDRQARVLEIIRNYNINAQQRDALQVIQEDTGPIVDNVDETLQQQDAVIRNLIDYNRAQGTPQRVQQISPQEVQQIVPEVGDQNQIPTEEYIASKDCETYIDNKFDNIIEAIIYKIAGDLNTSPSALTGFLRSIIDNSDIVKVVQDIRDVSNREDATVGAPERDELVEQNLVGEQVLNGQKVDTLVSVVVEKPIDIENISETRLGQELPLVQENVDDLDVVRRRIQNQVEELKRTEGIKADQNILNSLILSYVIRGKPMNLFVKYAKVQPEYSEEIQKYLNAQSLSFAYANQQDARPSTGRSVFNDLYRRTQGRPSAERFDFRQNMMPADSVYSDLYSRPQVRPSAERYLDNISAFHPSYNDAIDARYYSPEMIEQAYMRQAGPGPIYQGRPSFDNQFGFNPSFLAPGSTIPLRIRARKNGWVPRQTELVNPAFDRRREFQWR